MINNTIHELSDEQIEELSKRLYGNDMRCTVVGIAVHHEADRRQGMRDEARANEILKHFLIDHPNEPLSAETEARLDTAYQEIIDRKTEYRGDFTKPEPDFSEAIKVLYEWDEQFGSLEYQRPANERTSVRAAIIILKKAQTK